MLTVSQVAALRKRSAEGGGVTHVEGMPIESTVITINREPSPAVSAIAASRAVFHEPSRIFGRPVDASCLRDVKTGSLLLAPRDVRRIENARIIGHCAVLGPDNDLYSPNPVTETALDWALAINRTDHQGFLLERVDGGVRASFLAHAPPLRRPLDVVFFHNIEPGNYGSFLIRQLQNMEATRALCGACDAYVTPEQTPWFMEALDLLGLPRRPVYPAAGVAGDIFRSVTFANEIDNEGFIFPDARESIRNLFGLASLPQGPEKIYVSRSLSSKYRPNYRVLVNELEVENAARERGYEVIYPETLRLIEQAHVFSNARRIIGPSGSGMLNAIFCSPGTRLVDMESFTYTVRQHAKVYASSGIDYSFIFGEIENDDRPLLLRNWAVPLPLLREGLDWLDENV